MSYSKCGAFDFFQAGNALGRDFNAWGHGLLLGFNPDRDRALLHLADSLYALSAHVLDAGVDAAFIAAMAPGDAFRPGSANQRGKTNRYAS